MTSSAAQQVLEFLIREGQKAHSADELTALLGLDSGTVQAALEELEAQGAAAPENVSGYGGSDTVWRASQGT
ncbi:MAG: MarR family transcriptional regulator [Deinococcus sp.]|nr:MarR family transcriptional regulator [Deinococcus sp.]